MESNTLDAPGTGEDDGFSGRIVVSIPGKKNPSLFSGLGIAKRDMNCYGSVAYSGSKYGPIDVKPFASP
jgi:hypothetical protein